MPTRDCLAGLLLFLVADAATWPIHAAPKRNGADQPAEVATRGQRDAKDIRYGAWQKLCFKAGGAPTLCRTSITGQFPTGQTAVRLDLIERADSAAARLQLFVPVGMYLQQPPKLRVGREPPVLVPYTWCLTNLCIAADVARPKLIKDMESGQTLTLELVDSNLLTVTTSIPLEQFAPAYKGAPTGTLEQHIDE